MGKVSEPKQCKDKACGQMIRFIENSRTGRKMPVDADRVIVQHENSGMIVTEDGRVIKDPPVGTVGYAPHWVTCAGAERFRRPTPIDTRRQ